MPFCNLLGVLQSCGLGEIDKKEEGTSFRMTFKC